MKRSESIADRIAATLSELRAPVPEPLQAEIVHRVAAFVEAEIARERERYVELCLKRAELWERTPLAGSEAPAMAREEARARANEAKYLADLIEREQEIFDSLPAPVTH